MMKHLVSVGAALGVTFGTLSASALTVTPTTNAGDLVGTILGSGISYSNAVLTGAAGAAGTFASGGNIGIESGILLTSGSVNNAVGPNNQTGAGTNTTAGGDAQLNGLIPGIVTQDATTLSFDFTTTSGDLYFQYVFASEEYNEYVNQGFNDVFGFFVNGTNVALIPGTSTPVSIDNVNLGANSGYYVNNTPVATVNTQYDGLTTVLTAAITGLTAGLHSIKLAIADAGDGALDSGVFIKAGSFSATQPPDSKIPELDPASALSAAMLLALGGLILAGRRRDEWSPTLA